MTISEGTPRSHKETHPLRGEVARSFYRHFRGVFEDPHSDRERRRLESEKGRFREEILSDPNITKEDLTSFLAEHGVEWSRGQSLHRRDSEGTF